jgi:hypothetical protein
MNDFNDDFLRIRNVPNQWLPEIEHRQLYRVRVDTWFFGLLPVYEYRFTDWQKEQYNE